ncbi:hypothetical protein AJ79_03061 [Helicocarpus griseus UAMH5409]|uniref:DUF410 domain-containing protein n=1 Tax=Helicocarpus griseus UAMH5409 TaxID=1447875 RepID=A0A2B7Y0U4_9EURO|nr:hypothetical protein AJ79_03061 [Helicocarpus griseus UAMH5409]
MTSKIEKTIGRQQEKIASGAYYESHQQLRVIAARYLKQANYDAAADILAAGAKALLKAPGASASGGDLAIMLVIDVYNKAEWEVGDDEVGRGRKERLIELLREFPPEEPTRKRYINEMVGWSARFGELERGDPEIHHAIGVLFAQENEPYDAERHLAIGTADSAETLARLEYDWYTHDQPHTAGIYASRAVFPYLLTGNLRNANKAFLIFTSRLSSASSTALNDQQVSSKTADVRVYPSLPLLNFTSLLLLAIQHGTSDLFRQLTRQYATHIREVEGWERVLAHVGELYFGIKIPKQSNPLMDMMGMMFGGGGGAGGGSGAKPGRQQQSPGRVEGPPPSMDLD